MPINYNFDTVNKFIPDTDKPDPFSIPQLPKNFPLSVSKEEQKELEEQINLVSGYARSASRMYNFFTANPVAHLSGGKKEIDLPFQPTDEALPAEVREKALLVEVSEVYDKASRAGLDGLAEAEARLAMDTERLRILPEYSNNEFITVEYPDGSVKVAFRGTQSEAVIKTGRHAGKSETALWGDIIGTGREVHTQQWKDANRMLNKLIADGKNITELLGFSMGATKAIHFGDNLRIPTTTFNPFLGVRALFQEKLSPEIIHNIWNTTGDLASMGLGLTKPNNFKVNTIEPLMALKASNEKLILSGSGVDELKALLNPKGLHSLRNFVDSAERSTFAVFDAKEMRKVGRAHNEAVMIDQAVKAKAGGKTYAEFIHELNSGQGQDTKVVAGEVSLDGSRVHENSGYYKTWKDIGGTLTEAEEAYLLELEARRQAAGEPIARPQRTTLTTEQINRIKAGDAESVMLEIADNPHVNTVKRLAELNGVELKYRRPLLNALMKGAGIGSSLFGLGANLLAGEMASQINLDDLHPEVRSLIVGSIAGGGGEAIIQGAKGAVSTALQASHAANQIATGEKTMADIVANVVSRGSPHIQELARIAGTIRRSTIAGGLGALTQELTAEGVNSLLTSAGLNETDSFIVSQTLGGATGGAISVAALPAIEAAGAALSSAISVGAATTATAETAALLSGELAAETVLAEVATTAGARALGAELGAELGAGVGSVIPGFGTLAGAFIGAAIAGGIALATTHAHHEPRQMRLLKPFREQNADRAIGEDPEIIRLVNELNEPQRQKDLTYDDIANYQRRIQERVDELNFWNGGYGYKVDFMIVPESIERETRYQDPEGSVMIKGDYDDIPLQLRTAHIRDIPGSPEYYSHQQELYRTGEIEDLAEDRYHQQDLLEDLQNDPRFSRVSNYYQLNQLLRTKLEEGIAIGQYTLFTNGIVPIPYFDKDGNMSLRDSWDTKIDINEFLEPPDPVMETIDTDQKAQELLNQGDIHGLNKRIREIFIQGQTATFKGVSEYGDRDMPQFANDGSLVYQNLQDTPPTITPKTPLETLEAPQTQPVVAKQV